MTERNTIDIWESLHQITHLFRDRMLAHLHQMHAELGLLEMRVVIMVGEQPGITQKELTERSQVDKAQMTRTLTQMEDRQWLQRRPDDIDRRIRRLDLNVRGLELYKDLQTWREELVRQAFGFWTPESFQDLQTSLRVLKSECTAEHAASK